MISFYTAISPFLSHDTCGDFCVTAESDDYYFWSVGDIGGHGSKNTGELSRQCQEILREHHTLALDQLLERIHNDHTFRMKGMTLFLARVYKKTPLIEYLGVGNIRIIHVREGRFEVMKVQEGIVGYTIPGVINTCLKKLYKDDRIIVATDGVSLHAERLSRTLSHNFVIQNAADYIVEHFSNYDDRLCSIMQYDVPSLGLYEQTETYREP